MCLRFAICFYFIWLRGNRPHGPHFHAAVGDNRSPQRNAFVMREGEHGVFPRGARHEFLSQTHGKFMVVIIAGGRAISGVCGTRNQIAGMKHVFTAAFDAYYLVMLRMAARAFAKDAR